MSWISNLEQTNSEFTFSFSGRCYIKPGLGVVKATLIPGFYGAELISD